MTLEYSAYKYFYVIGVFELVFEILSGDYAEKIRRKELSVREKSHSSFFAFEIVL